MNWDEVTFKDLIPDVVGKQIEESSKKHDERLFSPTSKYGDRPKCVVDGGVALHKIQWVDIPYEHHENMTTLLELGYHHTKPRQLASRICGLKIDMMPTLLWLHTKRRHLFSYYVSSGKIRVRMARKPLVYLSPNSSARGIAASLRKHSVWVTDEFNDDWLAAYNEIIPLMRYKSLELRDLEAFNKLRKYMIECDKAIQYTDIKKILRLLLNDIDEAIANVHQLIDKAHKPHWWSTPVLNEGIDNELLEYEFCVFTNGDQLKMDAIEKADEWSTVKHSMSNIVDASIQPSFRLIKTQLEAYGDEEE